MPAAGQGDDLDGKAASPHWQGACGVELPALYPAVCAYQGVGFED